MSTAETVYINTLGQAKKCAGTCSYAFFSALNRSKASSTEAFS